MQNCVLIVQTVAEIWRFIFFRNGGRPQSWMSYVDVWTTNDDLYWWYLSVSKIWLESMQYSFDNMHESDLENTYSRQKCFGGFAP